MAGNLFPLLNSFWLWLCHASTYYNLNSLNNIKNIPDISLEKQEIVEKAFVMEFRVSSFEFRVSSFEFRVSSFEFRVSSFEFRVSSFEFRVSSFEFPRQGFNLALRFKAGRNRPGPKLIQVRLVCWANRHSSFRLYCHFECALRDHR